VRAVRGKTFVSGGAALGACRAVSDGPERRVRQHSAGKSAALSSSALVLTLTAIGFGRSDDVARQRDHSTISFVYLNDEWTHGVFDKRAQLRDITRERGRRTGLQECRKTKCDSARQRQSRVGTGWKAGEQAERRRRA
jgi:heme exporter protein D